MNTFNLKWSDVINNDLYFSFEEPITSSQVGKKEFYDTYKIICDQLEGETMSDFVDFYFIMSPISQGHMMFVDDDSRFDFIDWSIDEGIVDKMDEILSGETEKQKLTREKCELDKKSKEIQLLKKEKKKKTNDEIKNIKINSIRKNIESGRLTEEKLIRAQKNLDDLLNN